VKPSEVQITGVVDLRPGQATRLCVANHQAFIGELLYGNIEKHIVFSGPNQIFDLGK
jgi:hypothetical protein